MKSERGRGFTHKRWRRDVRKGRRANKHNNNKIIIICIGGWRRVDSAVKRLMLKSLKMITICIMKASQRN